MMKTSKSGIRIEQRGVPDPPAPTQAMPSAATPTAASGTKPAAPPAETDQQTESQGHPRRWAVLAVSVVCLLMVSLDNTILNVALKTIQRDMGASQADMQWAVNSYTLTFAGLTFTFGLVADRYGRKPMLLIGLALFGLGSAMCAFADSPWQLIATRALMGVGGSTIFPATLSIITNVFSGRQRAKAIGLWSAASGFGIAIGPVTGGYLLEHWWWGSVFLVNVPVAIVGVLAMAIVVPNSKDPAPGRIDPGGVALSLIGIVALVYGIIRAGDKADWTRLDTLGPIVGGILVLVLFILVERRSDHPALDVSLFGKRAFSAAVASVTLVFFGLNGLAFVFSYYLQAVREVSPLRAGVLFLPAAFGIIVGSTGSIRLGRWFGTKAVVSTGMLLMAAGFGGYAFVGRDTATVLYELPVLATGLGMGMVLASATDAVMASVPKHRAGAGSAVNSSVRLIGASLGVAVLGSLLADRYREHLGTATSVLPPGAAKAASGSIGGTLAAIDEVARNAAKAMAAGQLTPAAAGQLRAQMVGLFDRACDAFVSAMHVTTVWGAAISAVGVLVALIWLPTRVGGDNEAVSSAGHVGGGQAGGGQTGGGQAGGDPEVELLVGDSPES